MSRQTRVLLIGPLPPPFGGARVSFKAFFDYLQHQEHLEIDHVDLPVRNQRESNPPGTVNHPKTFGTLVTIVKKLTQAQTVVIFGSKGFMFTYGTVVSLIAKLANKTCYLRFFGGHPSFALAGVPPLVSNLLYKTIAWTATTVVETDIARKEFPDILQQKTKVVPGYRPLADYIQKKQFQVSDPFKFVYVGEVSESKGMLVLLKAFQGLQERQLGRPVELHLIGAVTDAVLSCIQSVPSAVYHGIVENDRLVKELHYYDVFVFPSLMKSEGHPGVIIEAFMAGLPVITTRLSGPLEIVQEQKNGLVVDLGDVDGLADCMRQLLEDRSLLERLAEGSRRSALEYDTTAVLPKLAEALNLGAQDLSIG